MTKTGSVISLLFATLLLSAAGSSAERVDTAVVARIIDEGTNRSRVMETLGWLTDSFGPRLSWSPGFQKAGVWTMETLREWGLENIHTEQWTPLGRGWTLERYTAHVTAPTPFPLISYPKAWSPGTPGTVGGELIYLDAGTDSALESYGGKLAGKFVLLSEPVDVNPPVSPLATREDDSIVHACANAGPCRKLASTRLAW